MVDLYDNRRVQIELLVDCSVVRKLLKAFECGIRLRQKVPTISYDKASRTSKTSKEGSDLRPRRPSENNILPMCFNASQGVNVDLKSGMEGRIISVRQNKEEGEVEFSMDFRGRTVTGARRESWGKSRKRAAYRNGQSETQLERTRTIGRPPIFNLEFTSLLFNTDLNIQMPHLLKRDI